MSEKVFIVGFQGDSFFFFLSLRVLKTKLYCFSSCVFFNEEKSVILTPVALRPTAFSFNSYFPPPPNRPHVTDFEQLDYDVFFVFLLCGVC